MLVVAAAAFAAQFWITTLQQPLIDQHEFRQTQTALTALFLKPTLTGFLNYDTPVVGSPWSIPFEFPLYQWLAATLSALTPLPLSTAGRLLSVVFGVGCLWPALGLLRRFKVNQVGQSCFVILYLTSSIYLYWNRTFLIESTALFFTLLCLYSYVCVRPVANQTTVSGVRFAVGAIIFGVSLSLSLLVKATTGIPAFTLIALDLLWQVTQNLRNNQQTFDKLWRLFILSAFLVVSFFLLRSWSHHADALKELNPIGRHLTSKALAAWNFGSPAQRWSPDLWMKVLANRMLTPLGIIPGLGLLFWGLFSRTQQREMRQWLLASLYLALMPLLLFSNLHIVHTYYQSANQIFLLMAIATSVSIIQECRPTLIFKLVTIAALAMIATGNIDAFTRNYWTIAHTKDSDNLAAGRLIESRTPENSAILIFGNDWNSGLSYHSKRRSLSLPDWPVIGLSKDELLNDVPTHLGGLPLSAVISKPAMEANRLKAICPQSDQQTKGQWNVYLCQMSPAPPAASLP